MPRLMIDATDLFENPTARVPVCLVLDVSGSMRGDPIKELNKGVACFVESVKANEIARWAAELSIVTFGPATVAQQFGSIQDVLNPPVFVAAGDTPMGKAMTVSLDLLEERKRQYSDAGVDYYQPWLVLMTDGHPTDGIVLASERTAELVKSRKLTVFPIGIGPKADLDCLARFSPTRKPLRLRGLDFESFFAWLSKSVDCVSRSTPGNVVKLDAAGIADWAEI